MENTKIVFTGHSHAEVRLFSDEVQAGKMNLAITDGKLVVFHTEVFPDFDGRGFAKLLLNELVRYAKAENLKIVPLCPYVSAQFNRHPEEYQEVWSKNWHP